MKRSKKFIPTGKDNNIVFTVMLQPMDADAPDKGKHKFMVQSMFASTVGDDVEKLVGWFQSPTQLFIKNWS